MIGNPHNCVVATGHKTVVHLSILVCCGHVVCVRILHVHDVPTMRNSFLILVVHLLIGSFVGSSDLYPCGLCRVAGLSVEGTLYNPNHFAAQLPDDAPIVFYIGAMASGHLTKDENPEVLSQDFLGL